ncbi:hypothetical protein [Pseudomonas sp. NPDC089569]|uniref:hypothetical protein n=1 Tax=Pseudomonas sp. NPDC089569 TaxID=3390722 RepID=UPI003D02E663
MRTIPHMPTDPSKNENLAAAQSVTDETSYLLSSKANAQRLLKSIEALRQQKSNPTSNTRSIPFQELT